MTAHWKGWEHPLAAQSLKLDASAAVSQSGAEGLEAWSDAGLQSALEGWQSWVLMSVKDGQQHWLQASGCTHQQGAKVGNSNSFSFRLQIWAMEEVPLTPGKGPPPPSGRQVYRATPKQVLVEFRSGQINNQNYPSQQTGDPLWMWVAPTKGKGPGQNKRKETAEQKEAIQ